MAGFKDHELMLRIREEEFTFVTNNAIDFRQLYKREDIHAGLIILIPSVAPAIQRELFQAALEFVGNRELINAVLEVGADGEQIEIKQYDLP